MPKNRAYLDSIERNEGVLRRDTAALEAAARAVVANDANHPLGGALAALDNLLDTWDVSYRKENRERLFSQLYAVAQAHFRSLVVVTALPKDTTYRCKAGGFGRCSRRPRSLINGKPACWQHEDEQTRRDARATMEEATRLRDTYPPGRYDTASVDDIWAAVADRLAIVRSLPLSEEHSRHLASILDPFEAKWGPVA